MAAVQAFNSAAGKAASRLRPLHDQARITSSNSTVCQLPMKRRELSHSQTACPLITPQLNHRAISRSVFCGKKLKPCGSNRSSRSYSVGKGATQKSAIQASVLDGVHMEPGGLVVLEEEVRLTREEWEEAKKTVRRKKATEQWIEQIIFNCRFFTLAGVAGSLFGSFLCFLKGSYYVYKALQGFLKLVLVSHDKSQVVMKLIEALDTYLVGTVMLIFGMGLYELFVMKLGGPAEMEHHNSSFFGLFRLEERPTWLAINGLDDLKTKLGHVIVMILLVGMFEKSKKVHPQNSTDLFLTAGSVLMCAGSLYLLNRLKH